MMCKAIAEKSQHVPSPASPLSPKDILNICEYIDNNQPLSPAIKAAIILAYATFLRVSNVLSPSKHQFGGAHTLHANDIQVVPSGLVVRIRSTKTRKGGKPHVVNIVPAPTLLACLVRAWLAYYHFVRPCPIGPAFMLDGFTPLTPGPVVYIIRKALSKAGACNPSSYSFHSLRRGGAQTALDQGADTQDIMSHGMWKSRSGLAAYIKPHPLLVPSLLFGALAN